MTDPVALAQVRPDPAVQTEAKGAHALRSSSVPVVPVVVVPAAPVALAVPAVSVAQAAVDPVAAVALEADVAVVLVAEPLAHSVAVAKRAGLASRSGRSAKNLR